MGFEPPPTDLENLYTSQTHPYFRAPHLYIALAAPAGCAGARAVDNHGQRPGRARGRRTSGLQLERKPQGLAEPGLLGYGAAHQPRPQPLRPHLHGELHPSGRRDQSLDLAGQFHGLRRRPDRLRRDAPLHAAALRTGRRLPGAADPEAGRLRLRQRPLRGRRDDREQYGFSGRGAGRRLRDERGAGFLRIEIQDAGGAPLPEFALARCDEIFGDRIERVVTWQGNRDLSRVAGKAVRLRFMMKDADLYSLAIRLVPWRASARLVLLTAPCPRGARCRTFLGHRVAVGVERGRCRPRTGERLGAGDGERGRGRRPLRTPAEGAVRCRITVSSSTTSQLSYNDVSGAPE